MRNNHGDVEMELNEERAKQMMLSIGRAVMDLSAASERVTNKSIAKKLGEYRRDCSVLPDKLIYLDAEQIVMGVGYKKTAHRGGR